MKKNRLLALLLAILIIFVLVACDDVEPKKVDSGKQEPSADEDSLDADSVDEDDSGEDDIDDDAEDEHAQSSTFAIGDTIEMGDLEFTVHEAKVDAEGSDFIKPDEGKQYIRIMMTVENKGNEEDVISSMMMFKLVDEEGMSQDFAIIDNQEGQLDGDLGAGRKMKGELIYEVSKDIKELELEINPTFGTGIAIVSIPVQ